MCRINFFLLVVASIVPLLLGAKCYYGPNGPTAGYTETECPSADTDNANGTTCFVLECISTSGAQLETRGMGCGTCADRNLDGLHGCKCTQCFGNLCNGKPKGAIKQCYGGQPYVLSARNHGVVNCDISNNDGCHMKICGKLHADYHKGCGKCVSAIDQNGCKCYDCVGDNCNKGDAHCRSLYFSRFISDKKLCEKWMKDADKFGEDADKFGEDADD